ncbi:hypothetical protein PESP_a1253 [Pseudoalteromonas espejiana DSM 9414]|nr:hypothetical protein PESP_a1253 [Pseudoalteromonas espejiana DSM 9414]
MSVYPYSINPPAPTKAPVSNQRLMVCTLLPLAKTLVLTATVKSD